MIQNLLNAKTDNDLIRSSAIIWLMNKYLRVIFFRFIISLIQCQRIFMYFDFLWYSELMMRSITFLLFAKISTNWSSSRNFSSWRSCLIQIAFLAVFDRIIYSISQDDKTMMNCCLNEWLIICHVMWLPIILKVAEAVY
jgi:hypothetical protein